MIPYSTQCIEQDDIEAVAHALQQEYLTCGPLVNAFEQKFADYVGAKYAVAVASGTAALHAACSAIGIHEGDEVITTPNTWVSSANAVLYCGGTPVFADIDKDTYNIDAEEILSKITSKTRAIIAVHYAGQPCDMERIHEIAQQYNLFVIEDAAHAVGAVYHGKKIGSISDMTTFSFHPVKQITTCEGGMITTDSEVLHDRLVRFRAYGIVKTQDDMEREGPWFADQTSLGYNYRLSDVQCALGISQLNKIEKFVARRRQIAKIYHQEFASFDCITLPRQADEDISSYHLFPVLVDAQKRRKIYEALRDMGIGVGVHYFPVYRNTFYRNHGYASTRCCESEEFYSRELSLPIHYKLSDSDLEYVITSMKKLLL